MIRPAVPADMPRLVEMGLAFFTEAGHEGKTGAFCPESFAHTVGLLIDNKLMLTAERGGEIVGMGAVDVARAFWNHKIILGREAFFYIVPSARKGLGRKLLAALETAAGSYGATLFDVVAEPGPRSKPLAELYERAGYNPAETTFRKRLTAGL